MRRSVEALYAESLVINSTLEGMVRLSLPVPGDGPGDIITTVCAFYAHTAEGVLRCFSVCCFTHHSSTPS